MAKRIFDKSPGERLYIFFKTIMQSLIPPAYKDLSQERVPDAMRYLFKLVGLSAIILALIIIVNLATFESHIESEINKINDLRILPDLSEPIIFDQQDIVICNEGNYSGENLLVTEKEIIRKPTFCAMLKPACLFQREPIRTNYSDLSKHKEDIGQFIFLMLLLMLPGIVIVYLLYFLLKTFLIILILTMIANLIARSAKFRITSMQIFNCAVFAATPMILLEPVNLMIIDLWYLHVAGFITLFILGIIMVGEKRHRYHNV